MTDANLDCGHSESAKSMTASTGYQGYQAPSGRTRVAAAAVNLFRTLPEEVTFTVDVEPEGPGDRDGGAAMTRRLMDLLEAGGGRGTFFVLGLLAAREPSLVREIAARGHEVACHGLTHRALERMAPAALLAELTEARQMLEDLSGAPVSGFRAPMFSLTRRSAWAAAVIRDAGFAYSSSVLPAWNPMHGWPGAPRRPFRFASGLIELPVPLGRLGPLAMPFLGGMYLRYLPPWRLRQFSAQNQAAPGLWSYCHPYDVDTARCRAGHGDRGALARLFLRRNRGIAAPRLAGLLEGRRSRPLAERLDQLAAGAPLFAGD
jgi:polysaccharide deacetylase family protein (PEP-CTERM system associated)